MAQFMFTLNGFELHTDKPGKILNANLHQHFEVALTINQYRQMSVLWVNHYLCDFQQFSARPTRHAQAGHTARGALSYAHTTNTFYGLDNTLIEDYFSMSVAWWHYHEFQKYRPAKEPAGLGVTVQSNQEKGVRVLLLKGPAQISQPGSEQEQYLKQLQSNISTKNALQSLFAVHTKFKSKEQQQAMLHIVENTKDLIVILPTNGGKSALFLGPSKIESKFTIVVPLLKAISIDLIKEGLFHGVKIQSFNFGEDIHYTSQIVLISPEKLSDRRFKSWVALQHGMNRVQRIVIDEAHLLLEARSYRASLVDVFQMRNETVPVQLVLLSATLSPPDVLEIKERFSVPFTVIRGGTVRQNIEYQSINCRLVDQPTRLVMDILKVTRGFLPCDRGIIYLPTQKEVDNFSISIQVARYHSDRSDHEKQYQSWLKTDRGWMVATSGFGSGINISHVRAVFMAGKVYSVSDFTQMTGRGGRDLRPSLACIYWDRSQLEESAENQREVEVLQFLIHSNTICLRTLIHLKFDGLYTDCIQAEGILCSTCDSLDIVKRSLPHPRVMDNSDSGVICSVSECMVCEPAVETKKTTKNSYSCSSDGLKRKVLRVLIQSIDEEDSKNGSLITERLGLDLGEVKLPSDLGCSRCRRKTSTTRAK